MKRGDIPWVMLVSLLVFVALAATMVFFGGRMALYRAEQRALAEPATAVVVGTDRRVSTSRDSDGRTTSTTEYSYVVELDHRGERLRRPLLASNYEPGDVWFNSDEVDPATHAEGNVVPVLVRTDLGHAVTSAGFWSAYLVPTVLMGFGGTILAFLGLWSWLAFRR